MGLQDKKVQRYIVIGVLAVVFVACAVAIYLAMTYQPPEEGSDISSRKVSSESQPPESPGESTESPEASLPTYEVPVNAGRQVPCTFKGDGVQGNYLLYLPVTYGQDDTQWPLVVFLHGSGERGTDVNRVAKVGLPHQIVLGKQFPFILLSPQCPAGKWWGQELDMLRPMLDDVITKYNVDEDRIYLTGISLGGYGVYDWAMDEPNRFAALAPICGAGDVRRAGRIKHIPIWIFHGAKDRHVSPAFAKQMFAALKTAGGNPKFTLYPQGDHYCWVATYKMPAFYEWLLAQRRSSVPNDKE